MKKSIQFLGLASLAIFSLFISCTKQESRNEGAQKTLKIGISKIQTHPALDALEKGSMEVIQASFPNAQFDLQNANGEMGTAISIAQKFKADRDDLVIGIATPTAQALASTIKDTPVLYSAVTDPVAAGLVSSYDQGGANITGTSDMTPVKEQIELLMKVKPIKTLGHIYTSSETNAAVLAEKAQEACDELGIKLIITTVSNSSEVKQAAQTIIDKVDGLYLSTDNTVFSALAAVTDVANRHGVPIISADPSSAIDNKILLAWGFDYYKMGQALGQMAVEVLKGTPTRDLPTKFMTSVDDIDLLVNLDVADELGLTIPKEIIEQAGRVIQNGKVLTKE